MTAPLPIAQISETLQTVMGFFSRGGLFMWPLLICSLFAVTTMILRGFALQRKNVLPLVIESEIERLVPGASAERLARIVHHDSSSLARIVRVALQHLPAPRAENIEAVETRARHEMVVLQRGLIVLEIITGIAPLLGLIGAVSGGAQCDGLWPLHRRARFDCVQLFLEKSRSDVRGNGNARRRTHHEMLLRPGRTAPPAGEANPACPRADCLTRGPEISV